MRVLAVTNIYPSQNAPGRGVFIQEQVRGLQAIGIEVRVVFIDRRQDGPSAYYRMGTRLAREIVEFAPDIVHVMYGGVMAQQVLRTVRRHPVVVTFHGSDLLGENLSGWARKLISRYGVWCSRWAASRADGVIVVARHLLKSLPHKLVPQKIRVLPCGIDLEQFKPMDLPWCRAKLGWSNERFHVLFASSNQDPVKRPWLAQAAVDEAVKLGIPAELHQMTNVPYSAVPLWLNASDVLLLTSLHEGSPTVVKEALACGLPVVSVNVGDVAERIEALEGCHLAEATGAALAAKLSAVAARGKRLDCQAKLDVLSIISIARRLEEFYRELLAQSSLSPALPRV